MVAGFLHVQVALVSDTEGSVFALVVDHNDYKSQLGDVALEVDYLSSAKLVKPRTVQWMPALTWVVQCVEMEICFGEGSQNPKKT